MDYHTHQAPHQSKYPRQHHHEIHPTGTGKVHEYIHHQPYTKNLTPTWITATAHFLNTYDLHLQIPSYWIPPLHRQNDKYIMNEMHQQPLTVTELTHINHCRLYLQIYNRLLTQTCPDEEASGNGPTSTYLLLQHGGYGTKW